MEELYSERYEVKIKSNINMQMNTYFGSLFRGHLVDPEYGTAIIPDNKVYSIEGIDVYFKDCHKSGYIEYRFKNKDDWNQLNEIIAKKSANTQKSIINKIYTFHNSCWYCQKTFTSASKLLGYREEMNLIDMDIKHMIKYTKFIEDLGESASRNYLLYGAPGTGKTTLIKNIAVNNNLSLFIINPVIVFSLPDITELLCPSMLQDADKKANPIKLVIFEDFDRYLEDEKSAKYMAQLLNALDGLSNKGCIIRFFSCNNPEIVFANSALTSRMSIKINFGNPSKSMLKEKLVTLLSFHASYEDGFVDDFVDNCVPDGINLRCFTNYVIRYLFNDDFADQLKKNSKILYD
jgi:DNA replication protein DnaC